MAVRGKWIAAVALVATACSGGSGDGSGGGAGGAALPVLGAQPAYNLAKVELVSSVKAQGSCDALAERLRRLGDEHVGPYGFGWGGYYGPMPTSGRTVDEFAAVSDSVGGQASAATEKSLPLSEGGDGSFSGTNNQEAGVDEADTVKTDGKQMYLLRDNRLVVVDVSAGGAGGTMRGSLTFDDASPTSMLLADGVVMVFSQRYIDPSAPEVKQVKDRLWRMGAPRTQVAMVDVSNPDAPTVTDTVDIDGDLAAARMVGGRAHLAMRFTPLGLPFVVPQSQIGEDTARDMNRRIVRDAPLEQWLPHLWRDGKRSDLVDCDSVWIPDTFAGVQMTSIVSVPMGARVETSAVSLLAPGETVYASSTSMYVTAQAWFDQQTIGENSDEWPKPSEWKTAVHRFSIGDAQPGYVASGTVPGTVRNSFSLGEVDSHLVVATTIGLPWNSTDDEKSKSQLTTLSTDGTTLVERGSVTDLGAGETIQSVRIIGKRAYLVTFRQTDPFFVVDLSDVAAPKLVGELKLLGYSGYLHPVSDDLILGIGRDATEEGADQGMAATLFDVSDPASPKAVGRWTQPGAYSDVEWDHHSFLYWAKTATAFVPATVYDQASGGGQLVALSTDGNALTERGRVSITQGNVGETQCAKVGGDQIAATLGGKSGIIPTGGFIQLCGPNQAKGAVGMSCMDVSDDMIESYAGKTREQLGFGADTAIQMCTPDVVRTIERTIVVGDTLWTLAGDVLQANDLATLAARPQVQLG